MNQNNEHIIRVGSRKSELALIQTKHVISELQKLFPEKKFEIHTMSTIGDRILNVSLPKIGEKSLFTRDLEDALKHGRVDFIVHSLKDLPTALPSGMTIGAVLPREDSRDALVLNKNFSGYTLKSLPKGSVIGTSSLRRTAQIRRKYPHLEIYDIRGNLNTRLAKLDAINSKFAGIILAQAGLVRMGWTDRISQILEPEDLLYCVGQGALAVECRSNDEETLSMLKPLMCLTTTCKILAERSFLKTLGGGCSAPVAVVSNLKTNDGAFLNASLLSLCGAVWSLNGESEIIGDVKCSIELGKRRKTEEYSTTEDEEDDDLSPIKRSRRGDNKRNSPTVINDDPDVQKISDGNLKYLLDVHGELFKNCPYFNLHENDVKNGTTSSKKDECPLKIPIGQDFMGLCPYVDTEHKVDIAEKGNCPVTGLRPYINPQKNNDFSSKICPITERNFNEKPGLDIEFQRRDQTLSKKINENLNEKLSVQQLNISKDCEHKNVTQTLTSMLTEDENGNNLSEKQVSDSNFNSCTVDINKAGTNLAKIRNLKRKPDLDMNDESNKSSNLLKRNLNINVIENVGHDSCPFLQKVKQIDHSDEGKSNEINRPQTPEFHVDECKDIFCGIFRHKCFDKFLFKKCDELGSQLANLLIKKGALKIMKLAQDEIHQSIK